MPCSAISRTMALPTMAPSERSAIFFACAGVEMPKPTAQGMDVFSRTSFTIPPMSVVISLRTPVEVTLLPKVQVDIVVSKVPVRMVVETAKRVLHTGHIGDGKIFITDVENVVRVRTGEEGYDALQSDE